MYLRMHISGCICMHIYTSFSFIGTAAMVKLAGVMGSGLANGGEDEQVENSTKRLGQYTIYHAIIDLKLVLRQCQITRALAWWAHKNMGPVAWISGNRVYTLTSCPQEDV